MSEVHVPVEEQPAAAIGILAEEAQTEEQKAE